MYYQHLTFCMTKMNPILVKTFGGLSKQYYIRQFFFAALMTALLFWLLSAANETQPDRALPWWMLVCVPLYPYSRFVYESIVEFVVGNNIFIINAIIMMFVKIFTMLACLMFAPVIAPFGLAYLYFYHSRKSA